jgi:hypothetical protein
MAEGTSIYSVIRFNAWVNDYGAQKAGLPAGALSPLYQSSSSLQERAMGLRNNLLRIRESWQTVRDHQSAGNAGDQDAVKTIIRYIAVELYNLKVTTASMLDDAAGMKVLLTKARSLVQSSLASGKLSLDRLALDLAQAQRRLESDRTALAQAKSELNGWKGFWNGVATGITFGAYNPVQKNINKANAAVARSYQELNNVAQLRDQQTRGQAMQSECTTLLDRMVGVDSVLTDFQNGLNTALSTISDAHRDESKYLAAKSGTVASYYFNAGAKAMERLFAWMDEFLGDAGASLAKPANILSAIVGKFECNAFNKLNLKNDWHYVTVFKLSERSAIWSNRAGVSWVLSLTPDRNLLAIGSDCPYYNNYKEAALRWNGDIVTGIAGPDKAFYDRS